jgi:hypothetical protein
VTSSPYTTVTSTDNTTTSSPTQSNTSTNDLGISGAAANGNQSTNTNSSIATTGASTSSATGTYGNNSGANNAVSSNNSTANNANNTANNSTANNANNSTNASIANTNGANTNTANNSTANNANNKNSQGQNQSQAVTNSGNTSVASSQSTNVAGNNASQTVGGQTSSNSVSITNAAQKRAPVNTAYAPPTAIGGGVCAYTPAAAGASLIGFSVSGSASIIDKGCEARANADVLARLGYVKQATALLLQNDSVRKAFERVQQEEAREAGRDAGPLVAPPVPAPVKPVAQLDRPKAAPAAFVDKPAPGGVGRPVFRDATTTSGLPSALTPTAFVRPVDVDAFATARRLAVARTEAPSARGSRRSPFRAIGHGVHRLMGAPRAVYASLQRWIGGGDRRTGADVQLAAAG